MSEKLKIQFTKDEIIYLIQDQIKESELRAYEDMDDFEVVKKVVLRDLLNTLTKPFDY